jgi:predicted Rossmann fold flavoprotein
MSSHPADLLVLGGGPAGLFAALRAAELGARVLLLEKNRKVGVKILVSGGGRCNLTTTLEGEALRRSFVEEQARYLRPPLAALPPSRLRAWFASRGVPTHEEALDKVFPDSGRASVVKEALERACAAVGVEILCGAAVLRLRPTASGWAAGTPLGAFQARRVVCAVGGRSYPRTGTTGDGYAWLEALGLAIRPTHPALAGLLVPEAAAAGLAGLTLGGAGLRLEPAGSGRVVRRPLLFTHEGLSGPGAMDLSGEVAARGGSWLVIDPCADQPLADLEARVRSLLRERRWSVRRTLAVASGVPERFVAFALRDAGAALERPAAGLAVPGLRRLLVELRAVRLRAVGTQGFDRAEVTRGGVALEEVDPRTGESRRHPGLHLAGEILDIDGPIGGFNFQAAFATGLIAGEAAARAMRQAPATPPSDGL